MTHPSHSAYNKGCRCDSCVVFHRKYVKDYRARNPEKTKEQGKRAAIKRNYGLSVLDYGMLVAFQKGKCAICGRTRTAQMGLNVDHDHETGKVRGLLCSNCNMHLGWYERFADRAGLYLAQDWSILNTRAEGKL